MKDDSSLKFAVPFCATAGSGRRLLRTLPAGRVWHWPGALSRQGQRQPHRGCRAERSAARACIGQPFTGDKYFHPRPSAAGNGYDATSSSGSNLGPTSQKLRDAIAQNVADYRSQNGLATNAPVPADAVTASGSGLDPHISVENADLQAGRGGQSPRPAHGKGARTDRSRHTDPADLGILGDPGVNVLELNLALDRMAPMTAASSATPTR